MHQTISKMKEIRLHQMANIHHQRVNDNLHTEYTVDEYVSLLVDHEWEESQTRKIERLVKLAGFKVKATVSQIDFVAQRGLDHDLVTRLSLLTFLKNKQNVIFTGPSGVGKSFLAQMLGYQACTQGHKVLYRNTSRFLAMLKLSKLDGSYLKYLAKLAKTHLLILDDFGLQKLDNQQREILMDIVEDRHDVRSTIIASQIPLSKWYDVIGEGTIADAILDRIINTAQTINLQGDSLRKNKTPT